jgi:L-aminopeptidase/D-esterase-like protein
MSLIGDVSALLRSVGVAGAGLATLGRARTAFFAALAVLAALAAPAWAGPQDDLPINTDISGPLLNFDWPAVEVGIASYEAGPTGVTVFRFKKGAAGAVDVRGGAPGTILTDLLRLGYERPLVGGIVLSGGSAYGLEAIAGVMTALKDDGEKSGKWTNIAVTPGAIIYDFLGHRLNEIYPDKRLGQATARALRPGVFPLGPQGAGRMPTQGGYFGCGAHSGEGGAFRQISDTKIAAFVVVNAYGAITDRDSNLVNCHRAANWGTLTKTADLLTRVPDSRNRDWAPPASGTGTRNTTISLVVTNRKLGWGALQRLAVQVHTSMARAVQPFSTFDDGDTLYAVSTEEVGGDTPTGIDLDTAAGETMWDAILASVPQEPAFMPPAAPVTVAAGTLARYTGTYKLGPNAVITVALADGKLSATVSGMGFFDLPENTAAPLQAISDTAFSVAGRYGPRLSFVLDAAGKVTGALVNPGKWQQAGTREP